MSTHPENPTPKPYRHCLPSVSKWIGTMTVDLSRLAEFGWDELDALEAFIKTLALTTIDGKLFEDDDCEGMLDQFQKAESVGKALSDILGSYRSDAEEEHLLLPLMMGVAEMAYRYGVRDAHRGNLTKETQRRIADGADGVDREREAMRELYDDLRVE